mmetsp:Transcript_7995/g.9165  ORF Transcript_7995/g.9165 Transcript_7995/m.9165 type:complete len:165 (-) Transcript_7995:340-834(-)
MSEQEDLEFSSLLGEGDLIDRDGKLTPVADLKENDVVGLYFSAHWCPPCRHFTPKLAKHYKKINEEDKKLEIVFVSSDLEEEAFNQYLSDMPWKAVQFKDAKVKGKLSLKFQIAGIPTLIFINAKTNELLTMQGKPLVEAFGVRAFPYSREQLESLRGCMCTVL